MRATSRAGSALTATTLAAFFAPGDAAEVTVKISYPDRAAGATAVLVLVATLATLAVSTLVWMVLRRSMSSTARTSTSTTTPESDSVRDNEEEMKMAGKCSPVTTTGKKTPQRALPQWKVTGAGPRGKRAAPRPPTRAPRWRGELEGFVWCHGSSARSVPLGTCTSNARGAEQRYVARAARAAKGVKWKSVITAKGSPTATPSPALSYDVSRDSRQQGLRLGRSHRASKTLSG